MGDYLENETHECFQITRFKKPYKIIIYRDKMNGMLKGGNLISNAYILPTPLTTYKDEFIGALSGYTIFNFITEIKKDEKHKATFGHMIDLYGNIDEYANPIIIKYKMKKFN